MGIKITDLDPATALDGTEVVPLDQGAGPDTVKATTQAIADLAQAYTDAAVAAVGSGSGSTLNGIVSGCGVSYTSGSLDFAMSAGTAYIDGDLVSAAAQTLTLDAADGTYSRFDVLYLDDTGTFGKITGTPSASPTPPLVDPTTQLQLTFVLVEAGVTDLDTSITTEVIYDEGTEWTAATSGSGFTAGSTNNPNTGTKCIEMTNVANGAYVEFTDGSPIVFDGDGNVVLSLRSKSIWNNKRSLTLQFYSASGVALGSAVTFKHGSFGFDSSLTSGYQSVVISKSLFAIPAGTATPKFRITGTGSTGTAIGGYIDPIKVQTVAAGSGGTATSGITQAQADARYIPRSEIATSTSLGTSDTVVPSQKAVKAYVDAAVVGLFDLKGTIDCSSNPNYPTALKGDAYVVSVAGKIGGASGASVDAGDVIFAFVDNAGGTQASVGTSWDIVEHNLVSALAASFATVAEVRAGTSSSKVIAPDTLHGAAAFQTLTDAAPTAWDMSLGFNAKWTLGANRTLSTPTNPHEGLTYTLQVIQDGTGSRTVTWPASFDWGSAGAPTLSTAAGKVDVVTLLCLNASTPSFRAVFSKAA